MHNILKSLNYSWKQLVVISVILICLSAFAYCIFKLSYALLTKPIPISNSTTWKQNGQVNKFIPHTTVTKGVFYLSIKDFTAAKDQVNLSEGQNYFIVKTLTPYLQKNQCLYGIFQLVKKTPGQLNFKIINIFTGKKLEQYSLLMSKSIQYLVLEKTQLSEDLLNCKNWVYLENSFNLDVQNNASATINSFKTITFSKPKCTPMNASNIVAVRSETPNVIYFDYDQIQNKLTLCIKKSGLGRIQIMTLNTGKFQNQNLKIQKKINGFN